MNKNQKASYIKRVIEMFAKGRYSRSTEACVAGWLADDSDSEAKEAALGELWESSLCEPSDEAAADEAYCRWSRRMVASGRVAAPVRRHTTRYLGLWQGIAACLLVAVGVLGAMLAGRRSDRSEMLQAYCAAGETRMVALPDGTEVMLGGGTSIVYPERFADSGCREVLLLGEANFKVAKDARRPFVVKCDGVSVTALGTQFNLKAYPSHEEVRSTLLEGKVKVCYGADNGEFILQPSEQLVYNRATGAASIERPSLDEVTAWQRGEIVFSNATLEDILQELELRFSNRFVYDADELPADRYTFRFRRGMTLEEVMAIVSDVAGNISVSTDRNYCKVHRN